MIYNYPPGFLHPGGAAQNPVVVIQVEYVGFAILDIMEDCQITHIDLLLDLRRDGVCQQGATLIHDEYEVLARALRNAFNFFLKDAQIQFANNIAAIG